MAYFAKTIVTLNELALLEMKIAADLQAVAAATFNPELSVLAAEAFEAAAASIPIIESAGAAIVAAGAVALSSRAVIAGSMAEVTGGSAGESAAAVGGIA
jgi:hypothetical protein